MATKLGREFRDPALLARALTHRSFSGVNNERLEFLGDALIGFFIADALYVQRPRAEEGDLSRWRSSLVRERSLATIARRLGLGDHLRLGEGELKSGGWRRDSVLADAVEAVVAAVYLDGGFEAATQTCRTLFAQDLADLPDAETLKDPKTRLQEWLQGRSRPLPVYEVLEESGPAHRRYFLVRASLTDEDRASDASGSSRRIAEQQAASALLESLQSSTT
ncbi:ribonuclease III [Panacagrimonas perspica]|nr:ribonuclease III [Panacagrimonas perspica]